jgi:SAM-dependent methyltransferase
MLKMYLRAHHAGGTGEFWDDTWEGSGAFVPIDQIERICRNQGGIARAIDRCLVPGRLFLEGGCGPAHWVRYYQRRGHRVLGIDFAARTVERVRELYPEIDVRQGDVQALPLEDGSVHTYYSGGVVEHFEEGPDRALAEARRVIAPDGWFLCSVPDASPLRTRWLYRGPGLDGEGTRTHPLARPVREPGVDTSPPSGTTFYQYAFTEAELGERLERAGFSVEETFCYSLLWGLFEIPRVEDLNALAVAGARALRGAFGRGRHAVSSSSATAGAPAAMGPGPKGVRALVERIVFQEDTSVPVIGPAVGWLLERCANMRMFVARPR